MKILLALPLLLLVGCAGLPASGNFASPLPDSTPWNLEALQKAPTVRWLPGEDPARSLLYQGLDYKGHQTSVFAYYCTPGRLQGNPELDRDLPGIVLIHGGGGSAYANWTELWAERGYAAIAMDLGAKGPEKDPLLDGGAPFGSSLIFDTVDGPAEEVWQYHALANVLLAHSLIRSFPEVDPARTAVHGLSWGGYLTCLAASLDPRFKAAVPVYGSGFLDLDSGWKNRQLAAMTPEQRQRWLELWDPSRYLASARVPMFFINGTNDPWYYLEAWTRSFEAVSAHRNMRLIIGMKHGHGSAIEPPEIEAFIGQYLKSQPAPPRIAQTTLAVNSVTAKVQSPSPIVAAEMHFTTDPRPNTEREWQSLPAQIDGEFVRAPMPPHEALIWFLSVRDERGLEVTSVPVILETAPALPQP
ncbi:alpha/beta fold hydrolase [bacterium]|nr:alpha/beta fold hydrolase [bacterium]